MIRTHTFERRSPCSDSKMPDTTSSIIVAMTPQRVIGRDGQLPWHLSGDLQRFRQLTMGHHIIMGRKTYDSIGRLLPGATPWSSPASAI